MLPDKLHCPTVRRSTRFRALRSGSLLADAAAGQSNFVGRRSCCFGRGAVGMHLLGQGVRYMESPKRSNVQPKT